MPKKQSDEHKTIEIRIQKGIYVPEQVPPEALRACHDTRIQSAETLLQRTHCSVPPDQSPEYTHKARTADRRAGRFAIGKIIRPLEDAALRNWAIKNNLFLDNREFQEPWEKAGRLGESEQDVFPVPRKAIWLKRNRLNYHNTWLEYFHRLLLHNWLFPDTKLTFLGLVEHEETLMPIVSQMDISAKRGANETEVDNLLALDGFLPIRTIDSCRKWDYLNEEMGVEVNDLHDENVLIRTNGEIAVMDPIPMMEETSKLRRLRNITR